MKKLIITILVCLLALSGCTKEKKPTEMKTNKSFSDSNMVTILGKSVNIKDDNCYFNKSLGFGFYYPTKLDASNIDNLIIDESEPYLYIAYYLPSSLLDKLNIDPEQLSDEEYNALLDQLIESEYPLFAFFRYVDSNQKSKNLYSQLLQLFDENESIVSMDNNEYYFFYNESSPSTFSDADQKQMKKIVSYYSEIKNSLFVFPSSETKKTVIDLSNFSAFTSTNDRVDQSIFSNYDVTFVNCWTTWCGYCLEEMPEIVRLYNDLPDNVNVISICFDYSDDSSYAKSIISQNNMTFTTLIPSDSILKSVYSYIKGYPTSFCVDCNGELIVDAITGAPQNPYDYYKQYIERCLEKVNS